MKKIDSKIKFGKVLVAAFIFLTSLSGFAQVNLSSGLVGYYPFSGNANDVSGNNNNGIVSNATLSTDRFGNPNSAYSFDGSTSQITTPAINFSTFSGLTLSCWVNFNNFTTSPRMITANNNFLDLATGTGVSTSLLKYWFADSPYAFYGKITPQSKNWNHVLVTINKATNKTSLYINGVLDTTTNNAPTFVNASLYFGRHFSFTSPAGFLDGYLDDIRIYNRALSTFEVGALYTDVSTNTGSCGQGSANINSGLVAYYPFDGNANDASGNNYNGVASGTPILTTDRFNNPNSAYYLDGTAVINVTGTQFNLNQATWSFWANPTTMPSTFYNMVGKTDACIGSNGQCGRNGVSVGVSSDGTTLASLTWGQYPVNGKNVADAVNKVAINQWNHFLVTYTLGGSIAYYKNGVLIGSQSGLPGSFTWTTTPLSFGTNNDGYYPNFIGKLDDLRFYNRVLSNSEILALYNENISGTCLKTVSVTDTLIISTVTGITYNSLPSNFGEVKVYPNPAHDLLNISVSAPSSSYNFQIVNNLGTTVYSTVLNSASKQVSVSSLGAKGIYFIKITDSGSNVLDTRKLILE